MALIFPENNGVRNFLEMGELRCLYRIISVLSRISLIESGFTTLLKKNVPASASGSPKFLPEN
jgi:hypothetical protein